MVSEQMVEVPVEVVIERTKYVEVPVEMVTPHSSSLTPHPYTGYSRS